MNFDFFYLFFDILAKKINPHLIFQSVHNPSDGRKMLKSA